MALMFSVYMFGVIFTLPVLVWEVRRSMPHHDDRAMIVIVFASVWPLTLPGLLIGWAREVLDGVTSTKNRLVSKPRIRSCGRCGSSTPRGRYCPRCGIKHEVCK